MQAATVARTLRTACSVMFAWVQRVSARHLEHPGRQGRGGRVQQFLGGDVAGFGAQFCLQTKSDPAALGSPVLGTRQEVSGVVVLPLCPE